jgi:hypothetical protein
MAHYAARAVWTQPRKSWAVCLLVVLTSAIAGTVPAHAVDESSAGTDAPPPVRRAHPNLPARDPAAAFAKRLNLDATQTVAVRRLLTIRQARIRAVWTDTAIAADDRVGAVKAINENTQAQIRALLTEEQKKNYIQPRPSESLATDSKLSVAEWMNVNRPHPNESSAAVAPDPTRK